MFQSLRLVLLLLLSSTAASAQNPERRVQNIVLVHGAWADGSGWKGVYDILVKDGYTVSIVQERVREGGIMSTPGTITLRGPL
jgi:hypothetical protein